MANAAEKNAPTSSRRRVSRSAVARVLAAHDDAGPRPVDNHDPALGAVLKQVEQAVRRAYGAATPVKLTILIERGRPTAQVAVETLTEAELPAADLQAEQMLLGALFLDNQGFELLPPEFSADDFYAPFHRRLFSDMRAAVRAGRLADPISSEEAYRGDPTFEALGGLVYLADMIDRAPVRTEVAALGALIHDLAQRRQAAVEGAAELERALAEAEARGAARAAEILKGPEMLGADAFAELTGMTREAVRQKLRRHEVLGLVGAKRGVRYPAWQVTDDGGLLTALPALFLLLGENPWTVYRFLTQPNPATGGRPPYEVLRKGSFATVLDAAQAQARGDFA